MAFEHWSLGNDYRSTIAISGYEEGPQPTFAAKKMHPRDSFGHPHKRNMNYPPKEMHDLKVQ